MLKSSMNASQARRRTAHGRRRVFGAALVAIASVAMLASTGPASAHHGFTGRYDAANPLYVSGTVVTASYGYPHARIELEPGDPELPPPDVSEISADEAADLGGAQVIDGASSVDHRGEGTLELVLPPPMTSEVADLADRPEPGDQAGAIVYRECSTGELRVQLLRISEDRRVVRSGVMQTEVDTCFDPAANGQQSGASDPASGPPANDDMAAPAPVTLDTEQTSEGLSVGVVAGGVVLVALAAIGSISVAARSLGRGAGQR